MTASLPPNPLRVGLIGAGRVAHKHFRAMGAQPEVLELAAVCDTDRAAAAALAAEAGLPAGAVFADAAELIRAGRVEAVIIGTPHEQHFGQAMVAIAAGRHVLVEKPLGATLAECTKVVEFAEVAGVTLMMGMTHRFGGRYRALRERAAGAALGPLCAIRAEVSLNILPHAPAGHWVYDGRRAAGGVVMALGLQKLDLLRGLCGEIRGIRAAAFEGHPRFTHEAEARARITLEFASGATGELTVSYIDETRDTLTIAGCRGTLIEDGSMASAEAFAAELRHFAGCAQAGSEPEAGGRDALETMRAVFAVYAAARTGNAVEVAALA
jgi:predicted dehydrogenase